MKLAALLRSVATERAVKHRYDDVADVETGEQGSAAVTLKDGQRLTADLFIDCAGFAALLHGQALDVPWVSYADTLLCKRSGCGLDLGDRPPVTPRHGLCLCLAIRLGRRGDRDAAPFWRAYTQDVVLPPSLAALLALWDEKVPHTTDLQRKMSLFGPANDFFILAGLNHLPSQGIGQAAFIPPQASQRVMEQVANIRLAAASQSPAMREYTQKVCAAMSNAPLR